MPSGRTYPRSCASGAANARVTSGPDGVSEMHRYGQDERRVRRTNRAHRWWLVIIAVISAAAAALLVLLAQAQRGGWRTEAKAQPQVVVTAGGSSYHRINCRTVEGHEVRALTIAEARRLGRSPCAICAPSA